MPLTPAQALQAVKDHKLIVAPDAGGWTAMTRDRTRLGRGVSKPIYEDAVESAVAQLRESDAARARGEKSRLFDLLGTALSTGRITLLVREAEISGDPRPERIKVFDIKSNSGADIVTGETSLHAAVLAAESEGAFR